MRWANFLHFYQPAGQQPDILEAIVNQSYRPLIEGFKRHKKIRLTLNISGTLFELFDKYNYRDLIDILKKLGEEGRIEFTSSSKYHAILPFLQKKEVVRQIKLNDEANKFFLGGAYRPKGFFPPEMAYSEELGAIISEMGFEWMLLDEIACAGLSDKRVDWAAVYRLPKTNLKVFFRERRLSNLIMSAVVRSRETLLGVMKDDLKSGCFILTAMDGETFGHHRPGLQKMLFDIFDAPEFELIQVSDISKYYKKNLTVEPIKSTWASSRQDIENNIQFLSWSDPENTIHQWQWLFVKMILVEVYKMNERHPRYPMVREKMDAALASDHIWWASAKPWWSLEMIEAGAFRLLDIARHLPDLPKTTLDKARDYYEKIITTAFNWQRTGKIREMMREQKSILRIPFKDRTLGRGGVEKGVYYAFLDMMKKLEKEATKRGEYEKAILWRDAIYKLKNRLDIYDTINAIDMLRVEIPHKEVEETIEKYKDQYHKIRGGQPEQRGT